MPLPPSLLCCPVCYAAIPADLPRALAHVDWHGALQHLLGVLTVEQAREEVRYLYETREQRAPAPADDDAPTQKLPPITETTRRRPPVPAPVRELQGAELLHELGRLLESGVFDDDEPQS